MSFLSPTGSQWRTPQVGKNFIVSSWRGVTRVQAWPRKRGIPADRLQRSRLIVFKGVQALIKWLTPYETEYAREAVKRHNASHTGQRASAAIRLRDWQHQRIMGRGIAINVSPELTFWPPAVARDASFIIDHVAAEPGELMQRQSAEWGPIERGQPGQFLTAGAPGQPAAWQTHLV